MEETKTIKEKTIELIDALKATCQTYGMGNDGNEYKIITQVFLYKFLNDKFGYEVKKVSPVLKNAEKWELAYAEMSEDDRLDIFDSLPSYIPLLNPEHLIANLWNQQASRYIITTFVYIARASALGFRSKPIGDTYVRTSAAVRLRLSVRQST